MAGALLLTLVWFWALAPIGLAADPPAVSKGGIGATLASGGTQTSGYLLAILAGLSILQAILSTFLTLAGWFLNQFFYYNTVLNPGSMPVVHTGWQIVRDISNAFFILVLLWIAFTIIFNIETLGGKKLLVRLIVIALLINFSLTMVSAVFGVANYLARPFQTALQENDIAGLITGKTKLHTVTSQLTEGDINALKNYGTQQQKSGPPPKSGEAGTDSSFASAIVPDAQAQGGVVGAAVKGCGLGSLIGSVGSIPGAVIGCLGGGTLASLGVALASWGVALGVAAFSWKAIINLAVANVFLIITIFVMVAASIVLLSRLIAMVFLGVLAPAAFLLHIIPRGGDKYWSMWLEKLFSWAFFAPAFYFLFYLSFLILDQMSSTIPNVGQFQANIPAIFTLIVFLGFLFASIGIAKMMGITVADSFIKWGSKQGMGLLAGAGGFMLGAARGAVLPRLGAGASRLDERVGRIQSPILRGALSVPSTGLRKIAGMGRAQVAAEDKGIGKMTAKELKRALGQGAFLTLARRTAAVQKLRDYQDLATDDNIPGYGDAQILEAADATQAGGGDHLSILKGKPDLALARHVSGSNLEKMKDEQREKYGTKISDDMAAKRYVLTKLGTGDVAKMDFSSFNGKDAELSRQMRLMFLDTKQPEHYGALSRAKPEIAQMVAAELKTEEGKRIIAKMEPGNYNFFSTPVAKALGWSLPESHDIPLAVLHEDLDKIKVRIQNLQLTEERLRTMANDPSTPTNLGTKMRDQADRIRDRQIFVAQAEQKEMEEKIGVAEENERTRRATAAGGTPPPGAPAGGPVT